jgi:hypothetical protein
MMKAYELPARINSAGDIEILNLNSVEIPFRSKIKVIVLVEEDDESPTQSFREGWADVLAGNTIPASQLWE